MGKTTLLKAFLKKYPSFIAPEILYRKKIKNNTHSSKTNSETQWEILNSLIDTINPYKRSDNVIFDRCPIDNIVYSLWKNAQEDKDGIDDAFIEKCLPLSFESMRKLDIIFFIPINAVNKPVLEERKNREANLVYIEEIDNLFKVIFSTIEDKKSPFLPYQDSPAIIELNGSVEERLEEISQYVKPDGNPFGEEETLINGKTILEMEELLGLQKVTKEREVLEQFKGKINVDF